MSEGLILLPVAWVSVIVGVLQLFRIVEGAISLDTKRKVADWLKSMAARSTSQTLIESPRWFIEMFDGVFGKKHLTLRCFTRSCVASITAVLILTIVWAILDPTACQEYLSILPPPEAIAGIFGIFFVSLILNILPDYLSLLETRWILKLVANSDIKRIIVLLVLDVIMTGGIFVCGVGVIILIFSLVSGDSVGLVELVRGVPEICGECIRLRGSGNPPPMGIFFY